MCIAVHDIIDVMAERRVRLSLTPNAKLVLSKRYLWRDERGHAVESPTELFRRVAHRIASTERVGKKKWENAFFEMMVAGRFLPNSPTLMNAGREAGQLSACFVLPVEDSLESVFDSLKAAAQIHQSGGGTGFSFSRLRPKGARVKSSSGVASGPVSFIRVFDMATETIKQGGVRRGANMAVLGVGHPDISEFISVKREFKELTNFNISVGTTRAFMEAVSADGLYQLDFSAEERRARQVLDQLVDAAWTCGDPGLVFLDRINQLNPTPRLGPMESTNPCGEQPLLPFESCNLGSLNLSKYGLEGSFDFALFRLDIRRAVRFLDNVIECNHYPLVESERVTRSNRKIGLGVMGLADLLLFLQIPYDSPEARRWGELLMSFLDREAKAESMRLAVERGAFKNWKGSLWDRLGYPKMRNATVSTVAPTGTISMIAGCSSGIEPIFAARFERNVLDGESLREIHPAVQRQLRRLGVSVQAALELSDAEIGIRLGAAWSPAFSVGVEGHVRMQAAFQRHSDSAVSKTINLPMTASRDDVRKAYLLAYELGCKGITIYRDRSRPAQVLVATAPANVCPSC